jgi:hypothetical protein
MYLDPDLLDCVCVKINTHLPCPYGQKAHIPSNDLCLLDSVVKVCGNDSNINSRSMNEVWRYTGTVIMVELSIRRMLLRYS